MHWTYGSICVYEWLWQKKQSKFIPENIGYRVAGGRERKHIVAIVSRLLDQTVRDE